MKEIHFYNRRLETIDRDKLGELQNQRLRSLMKELATNGFYKERLRSAGITLEDVTCFADLEQLPFTTKSELLQSQHQHPPFGNLLTYPLSSYRHFHRTSGTTGCPLTWLDTKESWEWWANCWGYVYRGAGVTEHDIVFCA